MHLTLDPSLLSNEDTLFSPVSAAKEKGKYVLKGLTGFAAMFKDYVDYENREGLERAMPTHPQAEALIKAPLTLDRVTGILVANEAIAVEITRLCEQNSALIPVLPAPHLFVWPERLSKKT